MSGAQPSSAVRLVQVPLHRAVRDGAFGAVWSHDKGVAIAKDALWALYRHSAYDEWIFIHRPTGLQAPALYAKTKARAAPVLLALAEVGRYVTADKPGEAGSPAALTLMRSEVRSALCSADTSGLDPAWTYYQSPAPETPAVADAGREADAPLAPAELGPGRTSNSSTTSKSEGGE